MSQITFTDMTYLNCIKYIRENYNLLTAMDSNDLYKLLKHMYELRDDVRIIIIIKYLKLGNNKLFVSEELAKCMAEGGMYYSALEMINMYLSCNNLVSGVDDDNTDKKINSLASNYSIKNTDTDGCTEIKDYIEKKKDLCETEIDKELKRALKLKEMYEKYILDKQNKHGLKLKTGKLKQTESVEMWGLLFSSDNTVQKIISDTEYIYEQDDNDLDDHGFPDPDAYDSGKSNDSLNEIENKNYGEVDEKKKRTKFTEKEKEIDSFDKQPILDVVIDSGKAKYGNEDMLKKVSDSGSPGSVYIDSVPLCGMSVDNVPYNGVSLNDVSLDDVSLDGAFDKQLLVGKPLGGVYLGDLPFDNQPPDNVLIKNGHFNNQPLKDVPYDNQSLDNVSIDDVPLDSLSLDSVSLNDMPSKDALSIDFPLNFVSLNAEKLEARNELHPTQNINVEDDNIFENLFYNQESLIDTHKHSDNIKGEIKKPNIHNEPLSKTPFVSTDGFYREIAILNASNSTDNTKRDTEDNRLNEKETSNEKKNTSFNEITNPSLTKTKSPYLKQDSLLNLINKSFIEIQFDDEEPIKIQNFTRVSEKHSFPCKQIIDLQNFLRYENKKYTKIIKNERIYLKNNENFLKLSKLTLENYLYVSSKKEKFVEFSIVSYRNRYFYISKSRKPLKIRELKTLEENLKQFKEFLKIADFIIKKNFLINKNLLKSLYFKDGEFLLNCFEINTMNWHNLYMEIIRILYKMSAFCNLPNIQISGLNSEEKNIKLCVFRQEILMVLKMYRQKVNVNLLLLKKNL
ncbi:hypothetical protein CDIK_1429 [Cucumispora dikerogammari]|nr:hypothetical protein CDIK_1429 [Cucumispora dikerogammari]